jgi:hypothetical protein
VISQRPLPSDSRARPGFGADLGQLITAAQQHWTIGIACIGHRPGSRPDPRRGSSRGEWVCVARLRHSPTADEEMAHGTGTLSGIMSTYNDPQNTRSATGRGIEGQPVEALTAVAVRIPRCSVSRPRPAPRRSTCRVPPSDSPPSGALSRSAPRTHGLPRRRRASALFPRLCLSVSARQDLLARICCNAFTAVAERPLRTSLPSAAQQRATAPGLLAL